MLQQAWLQYYLCAVLFALAFCECFSEQVYRQECSWEWKISVQINLQEDGKPRFSKLSALET